jgi:predicted phage terminase large subunit-like protein
MRKTTLQKLEILEKDERFKIQKHRSSWRTVFFFCWKFVLAVHQGGLKTEDDNPHEAEARSLNYQSYYHYLLALFDGKIAEINAAYNEAARRLFAQVNLDFDRSPRNALVLAFIRMVEELPEKWRNELGSLLAEECRSCGMGANCDFSGLFAAAIFSAAQQSGRSRTRSSVTRLRNSRVFTQITEAVFWRFAMPEKQLLAVTLREEAKSSFAVFRKHIHHALKFGWWQYDLCKQVELFYRQLKRGERPKLVLMAPPQHGKTQLGMDCTAWVAGNDPNLRTMFVTYSEDLGLAVNRELQRILTSEAYVATFGPRLDESRDATGSSRWVRNSSTLEYLHHRGSFHNTTVEGQITGKGLDLGIVDDPIKGRQEASSKPRRDKVWSWFTDDFFTRFSDNAGLLLIMTRWHPDDPVGRFIVRFPEATVLRYPAIAEANESHRRVGDPLFPEHKSLDFLLERKAAMSTASWESEYQQNPFIAGGGTFPIEKLTTLPYWNRDGILKSVRYWDKAATVSDDAAYSCGVLMHSMKDGSFVIEHVVRGRWSALEREQKIKLWAELDKRSLPHSPYEIGAEQEPGSGGKESAEATLRMLAGYRCYADRVTGSKEIRAEPLAAQVQAGNVYLVAGDWHGAFLDEAESFPNGKYKDQVDAAAGAFARPSKPAYNLDAMA